MIKMFQLKGGICELNFGYNEVIRNLGIFFKKHFMEAL